jgi:hypothetical protein
LTPTLECLDERVVPTSMRAFGSDLFGIAGGGTVWRDSMAAGWSQVGGLTGATQLVVTANNLAAGFGGQEQVFAQQANSRVSVYAFGVANPQWKVLTGAFVPNTMVASNNGVAGIAGGGTVWHYDTQSGWSQYGGLTNAVALVESTVPGSGGLGGGTLGLYAERSDNTIWAYSYASKQWTSTGGSLVPGTMVATANGVAGLAGGGTVWSYAGGSWAQVGRDGGFISLSDVRLGFEQLVAEKADASVWTAFAFGGQWTNSGVFLVPGTVADPNGVVATGVGGGGTVWENRASVGQGWSQDAGLTGAVAATNTLVPLGSVVYAQRADNSIWVFRRSSNGSGTWAFTGAFLV